ncbi:MAG: T9SS type B sorting domain-containing protein, partial [Flavobacteriaceae bacterium]|jgi:gliding motility-associated-like protein|nr:T9SS type B sorting domain-containing protein [Flavobacteriaceae bacterium]
VEVKLFEEPVITDLQEGADYITVIAKGAFPLEYSMDNKHWQKSNTFTDLGAGIYTFYVRSLSNGCEGIPSKGILFKVPNVITPNGDGHNDTWRLCGLDLFDTTSHIKIFDRYGKQMFEQGTRSCFTWDGKYLGRNLPTTSYWYIITIADGRQFTGWILLRNYDEDYR